MFKPQVTKYEFNKLYCPRVHHIQRIATWRGKVIHLSKGSQY